MFIFLEAFWRLDLERSSSSTRLERIASFLLAGHAKTKAERDWMPWHASLEEVSQHERGGFGTTENQGQFQVFQQRTIGCAREPFDRLDVAQDSRQGHSVMARWPSDDMGSTVPRKFAQHLQSNW